MAEDAFGEIKTADCDQTGGILQSLILYDSSLKQIQHHMEDDVFAVAFCSDLVAKAVGTHLTHFEVYFGQY